MENALVERLEKLSGPDREADAWIGYATNLVHDDMSWREKIDKYGIEHAMKAATSYSNIWRGALPAYTASLDAAVALVDRALGWSWRVGNTPSGRGFALLGTSQIEHEGATPAIALCIAAVRATPPLEERIPNGLPKEMI